MMNTVLHFRADKVDERRKKTMFVPQDTTQAGHVIVCLRLCACVGA